MAKGIELGQFIEKAKKREQDRLKLGQITLKNYGVINLVSLGFDKTIELIAESESADFSRKIEINKQLVYQSIPMLKAPELLDAFECDANPFDVVYKVFTADEVNELVQHIAKFNGIDITDEEVKN